LSNIFVIIIANLSTHIYPGTITITIKRPTIVDMFDIERVWILQLCQVIHSWACMRSLQQ